MEELTPLIIRLANHYKLVIIDNEEDDFWRGGAWKGYCSRWIIKDLKGRNFYWNSSQTEDQFLDELAQYFIEVGQDPMG